MKIQNLKLPINLRYELKAPMGELIAGDMTKTTPLLVQRVQNRTSLLVAVGDVVTEILVNNDTNPDIIITDGYTKREKLDVWHSYDGYVEVEIECPAAQITEGAWNAIRNAISRFNETKQKTHIKIIGEEDLLVLTAIYELDDNSIVVYGQPNEGPVIRIVNKEAKAHVQMILSKMENF